MEDENNHIDNLFSAKLANRVTLPPDDIWEGVESAMPKSLFFRFRYEHMNVYYCSMIVGCFLCSIGSLFFTAKHYYNLKSYNESVVEQTDSISTQSDAYFLDKANLPRKVTKRKQDKQESNAATAANQSIVSESSKDTTSEAFPLLTKDTASAIKKIVPALPEAKPKKVKKTVYIMDYDTIVKYDTLRTKKKRK
jgi:hypothetical protein